MSTPSLSLPAGRVRARPLVLSFPRPELAVLLVAAGVLYLWALDRNGFANEYYSAAVRSMTTSWHAFVYGAFDTAGVMTVTSRRSRCGRRRSRRACSASTRGACSCPRR